LKLVDQLSDSGAEACQPIPVKTAYQNTSWLVGSPGSKSVTSEGTVIFFVNPDFVDAVKSHTGSNLLNTNLGTVCHTTTDEKDRQESRKPTYLVE